jgi:hypothetical protein
MMRQRRGGAFPRPNTRTQVLTWALCFGTILLGAAFLPAATAWPADAGAWTNGSVLCQFASGAPGVNVSALARNGTGLSVILSGISEIRSNGSVVATAELSGVGWVVSNNSTDDEFDLSYAAWVPVVAGSSATSTGGSAAIEVDYLLPAYQSSANTSLNVVTAAVTISHWPWQAVGDSLRMTYAVGPVFPASEHLSQPSGSGWLFASVSNTTGDALEWMEPNSTATAWSAESGSASVSASPSMASLTPRAGTVSVLFGSSSGSYQRLTYTAAIGVVLPANIAGIPLIDFVIVAAIAGGASLVIAGVTRRIRGRPSKLVYADGETP